MSINKTYAIDQCRLYKVTSPEDLASRLFLEKEDLDLLTAGPNNYKIWKTNKGRPIQQPRARLQAVHKRIHKLLSRIQTPDYLHSAIKGRSYITNASTHVREGNLIKVDVKKFFQSVPKDKVFNFFKSDLKCAEHAAGALANLLTVNGHLPTGSSSSPILSYYAFKGMFDEIEALTSKHNLTMTCYVDDLAISGPDASRRLLYEIRRIIGRHGLRSHKIKYFPARRPKIVTGVVVHKGQVRLPNSRHLLLKKGFDDLNEQQTAAGKLNVLKTLMSRVYEAAQVDPKWLPRAIGLKAYRRTLKVDERASQKGQVSNPVKDEQETTPPF